MNGECVVHIAHNTVLDGDGLPRQFRTEIDSRRVERHLPPFGDLGRYAEVYEPQVHVRHVLEPVNDRVGIGRVGYQNLLDVVFGELRTEAQAVFVGEDPGEVDFVRVGGSKPGIAFDIRIFGKRPAERIQRPKPRPLDFAAVTEDKHLALLFVQRHRQVRVREQAEIVLLVGNHGTTGRRNGIGILAAQAQRQGKVVFEAGRELRVERADVFIVFVQVGQRADFVP